MRVSIGFGKRLATHFLSTSKLIAEKIELWSETKKITESSNLQRLEKRVIIASVLIKQERKKPQLSGILNMFLSKRWAKS
ncbi:hypothetical protein DMW35_24025 [Vibrio parahaemolyticus]|nr:hypothetical protein [Vibrio parahaemolyticus]EGR3008248.1 hypothetical protein [Vibrio parahaemolyticus]EGR3145471.1 hypothetical protein [Vibrio parahaemolyticus]EGR3184350.1 hypothetical protein [Vibrio parahaemolyticus]EGR3198919.1 hypothetical protein [Vibrio parahaemolyticus]